MAGKEFRINSFSNLFTISYYAKDMCFLRRKYVEFLTQNVSIRLNFNFSSASNDNFSKKSNNHVSFS